MVRVSDNPSYLALMARYGLVHKTRMDGSQHVHSMAMCCSKCGAVAERNYRMTPDPNEVANQYRRMGWTVDKTPVCPACIEKIKQEKRMTDQSTSGMKHTRMVMAALEERFDEESGRYRDAHDSDKKVADNLGLSEQLVKSIREKAFGPLKPPSEVEELGKEIAAAKAIIAELERKHSLLLRKFNIL